MEEFLSADSAASSCKEIFDEAIPVKCVLATDCGVGKTVATRVTVHAAKASTCNNSSGNNTSSSYDKT